MNESILHLFVKCEKVKEIWGNFRAWMMGKNNIEVHIIDRNIIFSAFSKYLLLNYRTIKYHIHPAKVLIGHLEHSEFDSRKIPIEVKLFFSLW